MKAQSVIVEFILFFGIAFSLFSTISYFFHTQSIYFQERIGESTASLINNLVLSNIIKSIECKACDSISVSEDVPSKIGGYYYKTELNNIVVNTSLFSGKPYYNQTAIFNLNTTFSFSGNSTSENKIIEIKINNTSKEIEVE